jgi:pSer/pThr/pTyr-binding forkhead associated (FHA) protein
MAAEILTIKLTGIAGACKGGEFVIEEGGEAVIGRSRDCTFRIGEGDEPEPPPDKPFKGTGGKNDHLHTVSRHHVKISFQNAKAIFIEDTSKHGTFINGNKVEGRDQLIGLRKAPMELRLGTNETFRMELVRTPAGIKPKITVKRREA